VLLHCHAGCDYKDILAALDLKPSGIMADNGSKRTTSPPPKKTKKTHPTADRAIDAALWSERQRDPDAKFETLYTYGGDIRVARFSNKAFAPVHRVGEGWQVGKPASYPLYRADEVTDAGDTSFVFFAEGEKDADNLAAAGVVACTMAGGVNGIVNNLKTADLSPLAGRDVVLLPDNDKAGKQCMQQVAAILDGIASTVRILELPGLPDKGDASDWLDSGGDAEDLLRLAEAAPTYSAPREAVAVQRARECKPFMLTDLGNAERFAAEHGERFRYVWLGDKTGRWYHWTGSRWQVDTAGAAMRAACKVARDIATEAAACRDDADVRKAIAKHGIKSEAARGIHAMLDLARSQPGLTAANDRLDADPWLFNTLTGTLDLRTATLRPHDPRDLITKLSPVAYDPNAKCPTYDRFIEDITMHRPELVEYIERLLGYALTGNTNHHTLPIAYGGGANGKSTLFDLALLIAGDYGGPAPESLLTVSKRDEHPTEIANLQGKRLVVASETPEGASLRINLIKKLTGDAELTGRFMRQDLFTFRRTHKLILQTNNRPRITEQSTAVWRRLKLIPFDLSVPEDQQDAELPDKLRDEAPGILARWMRACQRWQADDFDLAEPGVVRSMTDAYRDEEDPLAEFIDTRLHVTGDATDYEDRTQVYQRYRTWAALNGVANPWSSKRFYARIRRIEGIEDGNPKKDNGQFIRPLTGVRLSDE
jgi:putative DNA primase/helicase